MPKPAETTSSTTIRQIRPPPLSQHLREFASRRDAWVVLARNMIPVVGIYAFGWSAAISVFNYWFDGLTALAVIVAAMVPRALRETQTKEDHATFAGNIVRGVFVWLLLVGVVGLPYLDRVDSAPRSSPRQRIVAPACARLRCSRSPSAHLPRVILESVPHGLRHYA